MAEQRFTKEDLKAMLAAAGSTNVKEIAVVTKEGEIEDFESIVIRFDIRQQTSEKMETLGIG